MSNVEKTLDYNNITIFTIVVDLKRNRIVHKLHDVENDLVCAQRTWGWRWL